MATDIDAIYRQALGEDSRPFAYQRRIAESGMPELLEVPTGCGKTPAILLAWLYRRFFHPDAATREQTPTRLIWCLPLRTLTMQTARFADTWARNLGLSDKVDVHLLMGGEPRPDQRWRIDPNRPAIIVSTLDMALSRALNRGYLASRYAWPIDFALFNDDCHWVFDEVQLMDVALPTSRQLHGLRNALGVRSRHASTWMSATVDHSALETVDAPTVGTAITLDAVDRADPGLQPRLNATKRLIRTPLDDTGKFAHSLAHVVRQEHVDATLTLVVVNTVKTAQELAKLLRRTGTNDGAPVELLHSRFRRQDRDAALKRVIEGPKAGNGMIVVSTQIVEAGVDLSARTLVTECAPWSSIVQRAGRCNRWGDLNDARVVIVNASKQTPYDATAIEHAWEIAGREHGSLVTPDRLAAITTATEARPLLTLRRKDLLDLFDSAPDLSGNDVDVSRFIRSDGDLDVSVVWRDVAAASADTIGARPGRNERCPVPVGAMRDWFTKLTPAPWVYDPLERHWRRAQKDDIRPGAQLVVDASQGGYAPGDGFDPSIRTVVEPVEPEPSDPTPDDDIHIGDNSSSTEYGRAVPLAEHLLDTERSARQLCEELGLDDQGLSAAICLAARLHDAGKAHDDFQKALHQLAPDADPNVLLAKSSTKGRLPMPGDRAGFRHELASVAMLEANPHLATAHGVDADLVIYLVGAHHGRLRLGIRSLAGEPERQILGLRFGEDIREADLGDGLIARTTRVNLDFCRLGGDGERQSWSARATDLLEEHGPFRLAWMEAVVRIADWRASAEGAQR